MNPKVSLLLLLLTGSIVNRSTDASTLVVRGANLFDSETKAMRPDQTIVVLGERIATVGETRQVKIPKGSTILDGRGKYIIPGLIDAHAHVMTVLYWAQMTGDETLPYYLANGVTAIRNTGDGIAVQKLIRQYALEHPQVSPRLFMCSPLIDRDPPIHRDIGWPVTRPDQVPAFVADMAMWGVTTLKIYAGCSPDVARKVIEEGHRHGLVVTGHLSSYRVEDALADGIDCIEHIESISGFLLTDPRDRHSLDISGDTARRLIQRIVERKVFIDPTLSVYWGTLFFVDVPEVVQHPDNARMPKRLLEFWAKDRETRVNNYSSGPLSVRKATFQKYKDLVGMLHRAGVRLLVGTDAPEPQVPPGYSLHHEMQLLVESGVPPADVLAAATLNNARVLKQEANLGSIQVGKLADMVILDANPVADIQNSRRIHKVIKGGVPLEPVSILRAAPSN